MLSHWTDQLAQTLAAGRLIPLPTAHVDALLLWLSHPENPQIADLAQAITRAGLSRHTASRRSYALLDHLLFSAPLHSPATLGLAPDTAPGVTKQRYRRLIQVYHPDRHATHTAWATQRSERINLAFAAHRHGTHGWTLRPLLAAVAAQSSEAAPRCGQRWRQIWMRARAGWRRVVLGLALLGLLTSGSVMLIAPPSPPPRPRVVIAPVITPPVVATTPAAPEIAPIAPLLTADPPHLEIGIAEIETEPSPVIATENAPPAKTPAAEPVAPKNSYPLNAVKPADPQPAPPIVAAPSVTPDVVTDGVLNPVAPAAQMPIPAIALPHVPALPEQPQTPAPLGAAVVAAPNLPSIAVPNTPAVLDCNAVAAQLLRFQHAYDAGELNALMALYSPESRENDLVNWLSIRHTYSEWFKKTTARRIHFTQLHLQPSAKHTHCAVIAVYQVSYRDAQLQQATQAGVIEFLFERRGALLNILRVRY